MKARYRSLTLALHPNTRGASWIAFEAPLAPYDWGTIGTRGPNKNARILAGLEKILTRLSVETIVIEAFGKENSQRSSRMSSLGQAILALAAVHGAEVAVYSFRDVRACYAHVGARSRHDIAEAIARQLDAISHLVPKRRKPWHGERARMSLFSAAALANTHYWDAPSRRAPGNTPSLDTGQAHSAH